jgi:DNA-binding beta-propeller fold protein YncE
MLFPRSAGGQGQAATQPIRQIMGPETGVGFVAGVAIDPDHRELLTVNNDVEDRMVVFDYDDQGNVKPKRLLYVPHQSWGIALSKKRDEMVFSVQTPNMITWYKRDAKGLEPPVRVVRGEKTGMADPHGVAVDDANDEVLVANHGNWRPSELITSYTAYDTRESRQESNPTQQVTEGMRGRFRLGSITVFSAEANGDVAPKRTIAGPMTELNWPMGITVDSRNQEVAVANNGDNSVLVFRRTADGNAAPLRAIRGPRTGIKSPMGVQIQGDELWVANFGDHTALVFPRTAAGNVAPTRVIRNAPKGTPTGGVGNPYAVAYDSKREQLLVPN